MHSGCLIEQIVVLGVGFCGQAHTVLGGGHDDLKESALVEHGPREELVGPVRQGGDAGDAAAIGGQRIP